MDKPSVSKEKLFETTPSLSPNVALPRYRRARIILWLFIILLLSLAVVTAYLAQRWGLLSLVVVVQLIDTFRY